VDFALSPKAAELAAYEPDAILESLGDTGSFWRAVGA